MALDVELISLEEFYSYLFSTIWRNITEKYVLSNDEKGAWNTFNFI